MRVTRATRFILTISSALLLAAAQENVRLYSEDGWRIPGLAKILEGRPAKEEQRNVDGGLTITARTYRVQAVPSYRVMFLSRRDDTNFVRWLSIAPRTVTAYRYHDRLISVLLDGVIEVTGGTTAEVRLFYEDDDGSGRFHLMVQNPRFDFQPSVPSWARGISHR